MADPIKWYSAALKAAQSLPQNFGTAEQMMSMLGKYGAKASELNYIGVPKYLQQFGGGRVSKNALADYIDANKVLPTEVVKSGVTEGIDFDALARHEGVWDAMSNDLNLANFSNVSQQQRAQFLRSHPEEARAAWEFVTGNQLRGTKYRDYASYPDSDYKETLLTLPRKPIANKDFISGKQSYTLPNGDPTYDPLYQSSHWDEPNVLLHMRTSAPRGVGATPQNPDSLFTPQPFLEELQSDWGQAGRKQGFKDGSIPDWKDVSPRFRDSMQAVSDYMERNNPTGRGYSEAEWWRLMADPEYQRLVAHRDAMEALNAKAAKGGLPVAPLVTNTNDWASAGVRRFLAEAAQQDAPSVAWTTGAQQSARYQGHAPEGMSGFYDKMIPNIISKYIKPYGGQVTLGAPETWQQAPNGDSWKVGQSTPHTATIPDALRQKLQDEGIPFFRYGGMVG